MCAALGNSKRDTSNDMGAIPRYPYQGIIVSRAPCQLIIVYCYKGIIVALYLS
jgi:hypothetical protein